MKSFDFRYLREARKSQLQRLREWEGEINEIEGHPIVVENRFDLEGPPRHMKYITKYKVSRHQNVPLSH